MNRELPASRHAKVEYFDEDLGREVVDHGIVVGEAFWSWD